MTKEELKGRCTINSDGCWIFNGFKVNGYGRINYKGKCWTAHRFSFFLYKPDEFNEYLEVAHNSDCKNRDCINPDHLHITTHSQNILESVASGTHNTASVTHCPKGHEYTPENTYLYKNRQHRECRTCKRNAAAIRRVMQSISTK